MDYIWNTTAPEDLGLLNYGITLPLTSVTALAELVDNGPKNKLENKLTTKTVQGITYTVNADGTITAAGTATAQSAVYVTVQAGFTGLKPGKYVLSGVTDGDATNTYALWLKLGSASSVSLSYNYREFDYNGTDAIVVSIIVRAGATINTTFKPMICTKAEWQVSREYVPYQPSYAELVARVKTLEA